MITLNIEGHNDMCGGYSYSGTASFEGKTVKEVLDEIREYAKDKDAHYLGDGFGNPKSNNSDAWRIEIDGVIYWNSWVPSNWETYKKYTNELDNLYVDKIIVNGGWYCFYNFEIITKKEELIPVEEQTDLKMIKEVSKMLFTAVPIKASEQFSFLIQHPFASNSIVAVPADTNLKEYARAIHKELVTGVDAQSHIVKMTKMRIEYLENLFNNLLKNNLIDITIPEGAEVYKQYIFNLIDKAENLGEVVMLLNKPWYMTFIKYTEAYMSPSDLGRILADCWIMQEYPNRDSNARLSEIISWFKKADKKTLMTKEEYNKFVDFTSVPWGCDTLLTVYRGVSYNGKPDGLSWTTDYEKALWFASRFKGKNAKVYKMNITNPDAILAYFSGRNEEEVVIDTSLCNNWEVIVE